MIENIWYALQTSLEDDWGTGTYNKEKALKELENNEHYNHIAVILLGDDPICIDVINK